MRIFNQGRIDKVLFDCEKCGCVFEQEERDCIPTYQDDFFGNISIFLYETKCPHCGHYVIKETYNPFC